MISVKKAWRVPLRGLLDSLWFLLKIKEQTEDLARSSFFLHTELWTQVDHWSTLTKTIPAALQGIDHPAIWNSGRNLIGRRYSEYSVLSINYDPLHPSYPCTEYTYTGWNSSSLNMEALRVCLYIINKSKHEQRRPNYPVFDQGLIGKLWIWICMPQFAFLGKS